MATGRRARWLRPFDGLPESFTDGSPPGSLAGSLRLARRGVAAIPDDLRPAADENGLEDRVPRSLVLPVWANVSASAQSLSGGEGVCVVDGVPGQGACHDRSRARSGARARSRRSVTAMSRRRPPARPRPVARSVPQRGLRAQPPGGRRGARRSMVPGRARRPVKGRPTTRRRHPVKGCPTILAARRALL